MEKAANGVLGRPTKYTPKRKLQVAEILVRFADGERIKPLCVEFGIPSGTFFGWVIDDRDNLSDRYARAQKLNALASIEESFEIVDDGRNDWMEKEGRDGTTFEVVNHEAINRSRLRFGQRQWYVEQVLAGTLRLKKDNGGEGEGRMIAEKSALEALELLTRKLAEKATAKNESA